MMAIEGEQSTEDFGTINANQMTSWTEDSIEKVDDCKPEKDCADLKMLEDDHDLNKLKDEKDDGTKTDDQWKRKNDGMGEWDYRNYHGHSSYRGGRGSS